MESRELRKRFLEFFRERGHTVVPSSSLIPDDPSVLLTTAGMQQFKPYYTGAADPFVSPHPTLGGNPLGSKNAVSIQKSFRTSDIDEVGDERHLTFFEMMGNFSFGGYFKKEAIAYAHEFLTKELDLKIDYVTVFEGDAQVPADDESAQIWKTFDSSLAIRKAGREDNFWGPTGKEGPCGPTTEIYINNTEIWNIVFNEYYQHSDGSLEKLKTPGVDTGMGLERLAMVSQGKKNIFETDLFEPLLSVIPTENPRVKRILADHLRASVFLIADGVRPSNKEAGYILRRLLRRIFAYQSIYDIEYDLFVKGWDTIKNIFGSHYPQARDSNVLELMYAERDKFHRAITVGVSVVNKITWDTLEELGRKLANVYQELGVNLELSIELLQKRGVVINKDDEAKIRKIFEQRFREHQEISRAGQERKFGGHGLLLDTGELKAANEQELALVTRLHTATHLLQAALRRVLGPSVHQAGSDITVERTRFDFTFDRKLTPEELQQVESLVNKAIQDDLQVDYEEMPYEEAIKTGALHFAKEKYPPRVKVYTMDSKYPEPFSKELCGGPHVTHTEEVGHFKILKEEAVGAGIRRIRAIVE